uniref:N-acetyltransferase domain-containing protein n=1 Tax=Scophthalmus maximus TaxID=52904 RepID=A0A8D3BB53_SCOMX
MSHRAPILSLPSSFSLLSLRHTVPFSIREYRPSDRHVVLPLFRDGILEHVYPAFFKAMSHPDHVGVALSISMAGYVLGGSSYFQALLFGGAWAGLIYYCCHDIYEGYVTRRLGTDMADIQANYLQSPDSGFWVAESEEGKALDFCKEHGYARLVLDVSSPQTAAISLCQKSGFVQTASHSDTHANRWKAALMISVSLYFFLP